jgi:hypothetical protein
MLNPEIEADYLWVYFTLSAPTFRLKKIFILAECLIISMTPEYKMNYNVQKAIIKKAILVKQDLQTTNTP